MIKEIEFNGKYYPHFEAEGFCAKYIFPVAMEVCQGKGYDIGCNKKEWALPKSIPIDLTLDDKWSALNLPDEMVDYIFSSHCLEHVDNWVDVLNYWISKLKTYGTLFLYLPHYNQEYWRTWNNRKHKHNLSPELITDFLKSTRKIHKIHSSEMDINHSFVVMCERNGALHNSEENK